MWMWKATGLRLWGWVGLPTYSRGQADQQYFFVNQRVVRDKLVAHAIRQAYRECTLSWSSPGVCVVSGVRPGGSGCECGIQPNMRCVLETVVWCMTSFSVPCIGYWRRYARMRLKRLRRQIWKHSGLGAQLDNSFNDAESNPF